MNNKFYTLFGFLFLSLIFFSPKTSLAQITVLPKLQAEFAATERSKYADGQIISQTKLCSRLFKKIDEKYCLVDGTSMPELDEKACETKMKNEPEKKIKFVETFVYDKKKEYEIEKKLYNRDKDTESILACAILAGNIRLWMIPFYIRFFSDFILAISGSIVVLILIFGGYKYVVGSLSLEGEDAMGAGKKIVKYGIIGLVIIFSAWTLINVVLATLTG